MNKLIDVVIVTFNSESVLARCLEQLNSKNIGNIIVVDNDSQDSTQFVASQSVVASKVKFIQTGSNLGFAKAISKGVLSTAEEYILILNPDCEVTQEFLENVVHCHMNGADVVVPKITLNDSGESLPGLIENPSALKMAAQIYLYERRKKWSVRLWPLINVLNGFVPWIEKIDRHFQRKSKSFWYWPNGACFSITRKMYDLAGGLPEHYFMYNEDVEFGFHLSQLNCRYAVTHDSLYHAFRKGSLISNESRMELILSAHKKYLSRIKNKFK